MIVMKFGGTSVQDAEAMRSICRIVKTRLEKRPVVVLSACAGVTNALIRCARLASEGREQEAQQLLRDSIINRHYDIIQQLIESLSRQDALIRLISGYDEEIRHVLYGISITGDFSPRVLDFLMSYGERMSTAIAAEAMTELGIPAALMDARKIITTSSDFGKAEPHFDATRDRCDMFVGAILDQNRIPVLQGFIAADEKGITTTLGRGGSDFTAAIIGAAMNASTIEIWTDVDGILTADPKIVPHALRVKEMSFEEAAELAYFGAKVLHPSTLLPAMEKDIPVYIYNSRKPKSGGTLIRSRITGNTPIVKSISYKRGLTVVNVASTRMLGSFGFMKRIFDIFYDHQTSADLVTTSEVSVTVSVDYCPNLDGLIRELESVGRVSVQTRKALICIVGEHIKLARGLAARIFGRLESIPIEIISLGGSDMNLTFMLDEEHVPFAVTALHEEFFSEIEVAGVFE